MSEFTYMEFLGTIVNFYAYKEERIDLSKYKVIEILQFLFDISVIGQRNKKNILFFSFQNDNYSIDISKNFIIHFGLRKKMMIS